MTSEHIWTWLQQKEKSSKLSQYQNQVLSSHQRKGRNINPKKQT